MKYIMTMLFLASSFHYCFAQRIDLSKSRLEAIHVYMSVEKFGKKTAVKVAKDSTVKEVDEPTFVKLHGVNFQDGTIEVNVLSKLLPNASESARGFIGVAFRINEDNSKFECIYIRPTNGRADDQVRRNHSIQYFSFPDYKFPRLRKESPEKYESHADMGLNEWIKMKIVVKGSSAKLYLHDNKKPCLIVNDLKPGAGQSGGIGLFVEVPGVKRMFKKDLSRILRRKERVKLAISFLVAPRLRISNEFITNLKRFSELKAL